MCKRDDDNSPRVRQPTGEFDEREEETRTERKRDGEKRRVLARASWYHQKPMGILQAECNEGRFWGTAKNERMK